MKKKVKMRRDVPKQDAKVVLDLVNSLDGNEDIVATKKMQTLNG